MTMQETRLSGSAFLAKVKIARRGFCETARLKIEARKLGRLVLSSFLFINVLYIGQRNMICSLNQFVGYFDKGQEYVGFS